ILPRIFAVPTPRASPSNRRSIRCVTLHASAHSGLIIVVWAPESTNALIGRPLTSQLTYSIITRPNDSGLCSSAAFMFSRIASSLIISRIFF
ncbi:hypothetical protein CANCADRAFT_12709, partial [Tortispora caseinolytica NRRL Y-17796]